MKNYRLTDLDHSDSRLMPGVYGEITVRKGGVYVFKPGENSHPEPVHKHEVDEVFVILQGKGVLPLDGVEYPARTGDVIIVEAGEDHHLTSSVEDPMVAAWYLMNGTAAR